jgi:hypothetical protein
LRYAYSLNSGVALYLSNSAVHSSWERGGRIPVIGRHSVMLKPDSVRRVTPPTTTIAKTKVEDIMSHIPTERGARMGNGGVDDASAVLDEKNRGFRDCLGAERKRVFQERFRRHDAGLLNAEAGPRPSCVARTARDVEKKAFWHWTGAAARRAAALNAASNIGGEGTGLKPMRGTGFVGTT